MADEYEISDFVPLLKQLGEAGCTYFLEGGQAVNFWAEYFSNKPSNKNHNLSIHLPFTSKDCDIWVGNDVVSHLDNHKDGKLIRGQSPADGQLGIFTTHAAPRLILDLLIGVYGIKPDTIPKVHSRASDFEGVYVMDPLYLFLSKCHCFLGLNQSRRQDEKHVRMLSLIIPEHFRELLADALAGEITERQLIKEIKFFLKICSTSKVRKALREIEVPLVDLLPVSQLISCDLETVKHSSAQLLEKIA